MSIVMIGQAEKAALLRMKEFAQAHPLHLANLEDLAKADIGDPVYRHTPEHYTKIPDGIEVGLTFEHQPPMWLWHGSYSVALPGRFINPVAVDMINQEMGLPPVKECVAHQPFGQVINLWWMARPPDRYTIFVSSKGRSIMCHLCGRESFNPNDVDHLYCGRCKIFHERKES